MELIDTPNPNAKKILVNHDYEIATYIKFKIQVMLKEFLKNS